MSEGELELQVLLTEYNALKDEQNRIYGEQHQILTIFISGTTLGIFYSIVIGNTKVFPLIMVFVTFAYFQWLSNVRWLDYNWNYLINVEKRIKAICKIMDPRYKLMQWHTLVEQKWPEKPPAKGPISRYLPINRYSVFTIFIYSLLMTLFLSGIKTLEMPYILLHVIVSLVCFISLIDTNIKILNEREVREKQKR